MDKKLAGLRCGMLDQRSEERGDNGGCNDLARFTCADCGLSVCPQHTWATEGRMICSVCYGIAGYERGTV